MTKIRDLKKITAAGFTKAVFREGRSIILKIAVVVLVCFAAYSAAFAVNAITDTATATPTASPTCSPEHLPTLFESGNEQAGNMFDITAINTVMITSFDEHLLSSGDIEIYYKVGTHVGSEQYPGAWTLIGTATGVVTNGPGVATAIPLPVNVVIPAGQTYAFYVTFAPGVQERIAYTNGTAVGNVFAGDANIQIKEGTGNAYPFLNTYSPRKFNGIVHYSPNGCFAQSPTATATLTNTPTNTATGTPAATDTATSTPTAYETPSIRGTVTYANASGPPRFISNVTITGAGSPYVTTTTAPPGATAGQYLLTGFGSGSYTISQTKTTGQNGISSFDAAKIALYVTGQPNGQLDSTQLLVADVSGNGFVTSFDAGMIAKFVAGPPFASPGIGLTGTWKFNPVNRNYAAVSSNIAGEDYVGLLMGEVSGNWTNTGARPVDSRQWAVGLLRAVTLFSRRENPDSQKMLLYL